MTSCSYGLPPCREGAGFSLPWESSGDFKRKFCGLELRLWARFHSFEIISRQAKVSYRPSERERRAPGRVPRPWSMCRSDDP